MCKIQKEIKATANNDAVVAFAEQNNVDVTTVAKAVVGKGERPDVMRTIVAQVGGAQKVAQLRRVMS